MEEGQESRLGCACEANGEGAERRRGRRDTYGVTPVRKYLFPTEISSRRWKLGSRASSGKSIECQRGKTACQDYVMGLVFLPDIATHLIHTKNVNVLAHCSRIILLMPYTVVHQHMGVNT